MKKLPRLEKWFLVQLSVPVLCGNVYNKKGVPQGFTFYTGEVLGLRGEYAVCKDSIFLLGSPDKTWINMDGDKLDRYEF